MMLVEVTDMRTVYETDLRVFTFETEEWVIAENAEKANAIFVAETGITEFGTGSALTWTECPPGKKFILHDEERGDIETTYAELAATRPRGYLGSANY